MVGSDDEQRVDEQTPTEEHDASAATDETSAEEPQSIEELQAEIERLREELAEENDRHLRAVAELQNYRRRVSREHSERARYAGQDVISSILPVMDNLQRVLEHQEQAGSEEFARGVQMTVEEFFRVLSQFGVTVIDCQGQRFDPEKHEAVARVTTTEVPEGTVVAVDAPGYCLHDRCLRPARVVVAHSGDEDEAGS